MKKVIRAILLIVIFVVLAIDIFGVWKYKLNGTEYVSYSPPDSDAEVLDNTELENVFDDSDIEYEELSSKDFWADEKLFIIDIEEAPEQNEYTIKGLIYEEYAITWQEYNDLKNNDGEIEIFGVVYTKDKVQSNNLMLKSEYDDSESFYIKYNATTQKYIIKDSTTDYCLYKATEKYVTTTISANIPFVVQKNNKSEKLTVADVAETHTKIIPPENQVKINYSTIDFSRQGGIVKITELNL